ncbi:MAG: glycosyltransferase family 39 protein [Acidobacteriales bacterium]|nr:glycosyltransferase family 39 protein [Terriglobales bacterium]
MWETVRKNPRFFLVTVAIGLTLRTLFILRFPGVVNDSFVYGDIALNWMRHGIYGLSGTEGISPTCIRLPGYPALLVAVFALFGAEHYRTMLVVQMVVDLGTCFVVADLARRLISEKAAAPAFLMAAVCPFLADYAAAALTETWEIFFTALALDFAAAGLNAIASRNLRLWAGCGLAVGAAMLLRPDGALLLISISAYLLFLLLRSPHRSTGIPVKGLRLHIASALMIVVLLALSPLIPWTIRNLHTLNRFEPLAPRYANEEDEFVPMGFNRWVKTWIADYISVEELYWVVPGGAMDVEKLPRRAFDSPEQLQLTRALIADYNRVLSVTPELDARFEALTEARVRAHPLRYYFILPCLRIADMWLRPRTEKLPSDPRWWEFNDEPKWSALAIAMGVINLAYLLMAFAGLSRLKRPNYAILLLMFVILRSAFLGTLENPEPRYTLECYPVVIALGALWCIDKTAAKPANATNSRRYQEQ